jgi:TolB-like protein/DNA-binding winged helix-turn-helix (wHTH) protein
VGELAKDGHKIRLQDQPLQILEELLSRPGELVTREELIARLWPKGVVDFDTGLNSAVRKLRVALHDEADTPRYIETVPRKGYRFIGSLDPVPAQPVQQPEAASAPMPIPPEISVSSPIPGASAASPAVRFSRVHMYIVAGFAALLIGAASFLVLRREAVPVAAQPATRTERAALDTRTLAVLPLRTAAVDEAGSLLAQSLTDLIRNRLAAFKDVVVIASHSTAGMAYSRAGMRAIGEKLHARFLLAGGVERAGEQLRLDVELMDAESGKQLWATTFERSLSDAGQVREEIFRAIAGSLRVSTDPPARGVAAPAAISLEAYQLYMRGQQLMANEKIEDVEAAIEFFRRATILDPGFARAYVGLGQAQRLAYEHSGDDDGGQRLAAQKSFARALELSPALGEAWVERARLVREPAEAESLYRKGLEYAPNYGAGYSHFADFLFRQDRIGEAIDMVSRARSIDPLTPQLYLDQASFEVVMTSDVAAHDRLVLQALQINPGFQPALQQLAESRWEYSAEFAQAIRTIESAIALDARSEYSRDLARRMYLDIGEPDSAIDVSGEAAGTARIEILQYKHERQRAAEMARVLPADFFWYGGPYAVEAEALRDGAVMSGDYSSALRLLEAAYAIRPTRPRMWSRYQTMVYAHVLVLAGQTERGRKLAAAQLVLLDSHSVGRKESWLSRERAAGYMVLGEHERALAQLTAAVQAKRLYRWWYTFELDPLFEPLRQDPRFRALHEQARKHRDEQRALLGQMRRKGEVPRRPT